MVSPSESVNRRIAQIESFRDRAIGIREGLAAFNDFVVAGAEIIGGQIGSQKRVTTGRFAGSRDVSISREAGELLFDLGVVGSVDQGIVVFHERVGRDKPALRRALARLDRRAGRLPPSKRTPAQRAYTQAIKGGLVVRDRQTGRLKGLNQRGKAALTKVRRQAQIKREKKRKASQGTAIKKLRGFGQIKR